MPYEFKANGDRIEVYKLYKTIKPKLVYICKRVETAQKYIYKYNLEDYKASYKYELEDKAFLQLIEEKTTYPKWIERDRLAHKFKILYPMNIITYKQINKKY